MDSESDPYIERSDKNNSQYRKEWQAWWATLSPEERAELRLQGFDKPDTSYHASESACDISERNLAVQEPEEALAGYHKQIWETVQWISLLIIDSENPRLEADTLAFMSGFYAREGKTGTDLASKYGLTRAAWSKRCKFLQRSLKLPPSRFMKSEAACKEYALTNGKIKHGT